MKHVRIKNNMIEDLRQLVKIESVRDDAAATKEAPLDQHCKVLRQSTRDW